MSSNNTFLESRQENVFFVSLCVHEKEREREYVCVFVCVCVKVGGYPVSALVVQRILFLTMTVVM